MGGYSYIGMTLEIDFLFISSSVHSKLCSFVKISKGLNEFKIHLTKPLLQVLLLGKS